MARSVAETRNLVLKWKQSEQNDAFLAGNHMRCPAAYRETLRQGVEQTCIIYIPTDGVPNRPDLNACFSAKAVLDHFETDPRDSRSLILYLANLTSLPFPTPRELDGVLLEFGEAYGRRDYSREQHVIREIETNHLERILYYGETGTMIGFGSLAAPIPKDNDVSSTYSDFSDVDQHVSEDPSYRERMARIRRYQVRKHTLRIDQRRCIVSRYHVAFRGRPVALEVVHLWPLALGGRDVVFNTAVMHVALHQLYDRFAFTLTEDFEVIWARDADQDLLTHGLKIRQRAHFLRAPAEMPDMTNIRRHRQHFIELQAKR